MIIMMADGIWEAAMTRRSADWNDGLAKDLRNRKFAQQFIRAAIDEGLSIQSVLGRVIRAYGVAEFAARVRLPAPNILRAVNPKHNDTIDTIGRLLKPFGMEISVVASRGRRAV